MSFPGEIWKCAACGFSCYLRWEYSLPYCPVCGEEQAFAKLKTKKKTVKRGPTTGMIGNRGVFGPNANAAYWPLESPQRAIAMRQVLRFSANKVASEIGCDPRTVERWRKDHNRGKVPLGSLVKVALQIIEEM